MDKANINQAIDQNLNTVHEVLVIFTAVLPKIPFQQNSIFLFISPKPLPMKLFECFRIVS